jgi:dethiobiotin synthetase
MMRGVFITGTDTNVGKTVVSAAIMHRYRKTSALVYWKPIQTGIEQDDDTATVAELGACDRPEVFSEGIRLPLPLSPHLAALHAKTTIEIASIVRLVVGHSEEIRWVVEGAGGVLVPLNDKDLMPSLISQLHLPVLLVARTALGTINHTLLSLEAIRHRSLRLAGVVLVGEPNAENRAAIEKFGNVNVIAEIPRFDPLTPYALGKWAGTEFDRQERLREFLD